MDSSSYFIKQFDIDLHASHVRDDFPKDRFPDGIFVAVAERNEEPPYWESGACATADEARREADGHAGAPLDWDGHAPSPQPGDLEWTVDYAAATPYGER